VFLAFDVCKPLIIACYSSWHYSCTILQMFCTFAFPPVIHWTAVKVSKHIRICKCAFLGIITMSFCRVINQTDYFKRTSKTRWAIIDDLRILQHIWVSIVLLLLFLTQITSEKSYTCTHLRKRSKKSVIFSTIKATQTRPQINNWSNPPEAGSLNRIFPYSQFWVQIVFDFFS